jgi:hypothetical protein
VSYCEHCYEYPGSVKDGKYPDWRSDYNISRSGLCFTEVGSWLVRMILTAVCGVELSVYLLIIHLKSVIIPSTCHMLKIRMSLENYNFNSSYFCV